MEEKRSWAKIGMIAGAVVLLAVLLLIVKWQHDVINDQKSFIVEMKQLRDDIVRAQAQQVSKKDLEDFAKNSNIDLKPIREDLSKLDAEIKGISNVLVSTPGFSGTNMASSSTVPRPDVGVGGPTVVPCPNGGSVECPNSDPFGYQSNSQVLVIREPFSDGTKVPFGETQFKAWQPAPWELKIYPRTYSVTTVLGEDEDGRHYTYHKFTIASNGKTYPVKIDNAKFVEEKPEAKFRFNPRLYMGVDVGAYVHPTPAAEVFPNLQVSLFSYGKTKTAPSWTFAGLGLGYASQAKELGVIVSPVNYNIAQHLPLVENLHVGPSLMVNTSGGVAILGGLRVGL